MSLQNSEGIPALYGPVRQSNTSHYTIKIFYFIAFVQQCFLCYECNPSKKGDYPYKWNPCQLRCESGR